MICEMGNTESREVLREQTLGRLGCCAAGKPYVVPVNYCYEDNFIYAHSLLGLKINALRANPSVCLQVDDIRDDYHWRSVTAFGRFEEVTEDRERERILNILFKRLPHLSPVETRMIRGLPEVIVFRLRIERITGVSEDWH